MRSGSAIRECDQRVRSGVNSSATIDQRLRCPTRRFDPDMYLPGGSSTESDGSRSHSDSLDVSDDSSGEGGNSDAAGPESVDGFTPGQLCGTRGRACKELASPAAMRRDCPQ